MTNARDPPTDPRPHAPSGWSAGGRWNRFESLVLWPALGVAAFWGRPKATAAAPTASATEAASQGPVSMSDLQLLEHLAWQVDSGEAEAEQFVEAKLALLSKPTPEDLVGPIAHLALPTDELSSLERLHASSHLTDPEYEVLRRRVILKI